MRRCKVSRANDRAETMPRDFISSLASSTYETMCLRKENSERLDAVCEKLLDFCFRKLARRDFGVTTCEA
jgi:hypothetical protein